MDNYSVVIIGSSKQCKQILNLFGPNTEIYEDYKFQLTKDWNDEFDEDEYLTDKHIQNIFIYGRRMKTKVVVTIQSPRDLTATVRKDIETLIVFKNDDINDRKEIYDSYSLYSALSFELFDKTIDTLNDYNYLVIDKLRSQYTVNLV